MCCSFGLSSWGMFCCFVAVIWVYGIWSFGGFKGGRKYPAELSPGEIPPPPLCTWMHLVNGTATARLWDGRPPE